MSYSRVQKWIQQYGVERVLEVIRQAETKKENGEIRKSVTGWVRTALRDAWTWDSGDTVQEDDKDGSRFISGADAAWIEY